MGPSTRIKIFLSTALPTPTCSDPARLTAKYGDERSGCSRRTTVKRRHPCRNQLQSGRVHRLHLLLAPAEIGRARGRRLSPQLTNDAGLRRPTIGVGETRPVSFEEAVPERVPIVRPAALTSGQLDGALPHGCRAIRDLPGAAVSVCYARSCVMSARTRAELKALLDRAERVLAESEAIQRELRQSLEKADELERKRIRRALGERRSTPRGKK